MSIQSEITRLQTNITAALAALAEKGVEVPAGANSNALAGLIAAIEAGGGSGAYGTITLAEEMNTIVVNTGFAEYPKFALLAAIDNSAKYPSMASYMWFDDEQPFYKWHNIVFYAKSSSSRVYDNKNSTSYPTQHISDSYYLCHPSIQEVSFNKGSNNAFPAGGKYLWLATTEAIV